MLLDKYLIVESRRQRKINNWLQCYDPENIEKEFEQNGLKIVGKYSNVAGDAYYSDTKEMAVIAQSINY